MTTKPTHARGPGGVALALPVAPPSPSPKVWPVPNGWSPRYDPLTTPGLGDLAIWENGQDAYIRCFLNLGDQNDWVKLSTLQDFADEANNILNTASLFQQLAALAQVQPYITQGLYATGLVTFPAFALLADNQTLTVGGFTYEVQKTGGYVYTVGTVTVDCRACSDANSVAIAFGQAIGIQVGSTVSASGPDGADLSLAAMAPGDAGNVPITGTIPAIFLGMSGGADPIVALSPAVAALLNLAGEQAALSALLSTPQDFDAYYAPRGLALAGLPSGGFTKFYAPFLLKGSLPSAGISGLADAQELTVANGGGAGQSTSDDSGGVAEVNTYGALNAYAQLSPGGGVRIANSATDFNTQRWYLATRIKVSAILPVASWAAVFLQNASLQKIMLGTHSWTSPDHFVVQSDTGGHVVLGAFDTNWHVIEAWATGDGLIHARFDGGTSASFALPSGFGSSTILGIGAANTTALVPVFIRVDDILFLIPKTI